MEDSYLSIPVKCFQLTGFYRIKLVKHTSLNHALQLLNILCVVICAASQTYFIMNNFKDVLASAEAFTPLSIEIITFAKIVTCFVRIEKFYDLIDEINDLSAKLSASDLMRLKRVDQFDRRVGLAYLISGSVASVGYCAIPLVTNLVNVLIFETTFNHEMPFKSLFPYDTTKCPIYELTYSMFCWGTFLTLIINVAVDSLFLGACLNISAHLDILQGSLDRDIQKFVIQHEKILFLTMKLSDMMTPIVFVQFLMTSALLCVLGFQIVALESLIRRIVVISLGIAGIIQLFSYAYGGQLLMDKSSSVGDQLYETDKDLVIIIRRAHKAVVIKAGFYQATLPTFTSIIRSAGSLITLLQSFM